MACSCHNCRTGKCGCPQCSEGPGIDFRARQRIYDDVLTDVMRERARIRDMRAPNIERERVRRWGEITTWAREELDKTDEEKEDHVRKEEGSTGAGTDSGAGEAQRDG